MGQITLSSGDTVHFDEADAAVVEAYQWHVHRTRTVLYARGYLRGRPRRAAPLVYMHRLLTVAGAGDEVDHADGDGLNNRRGNLRLCTRTENSANRHAVASTTGVKGVYFESWSGRWRAEVQHHRKRYKLGRFDTQAEAAAAYAAKAGELFGGFANPTA